MKKYKNVIKRIVSVALICTMVTGMFSGINVKGAEADVTKYPYVIFAADESSGITLSADNVSINGNCYTNGIFSTTAKYPGLNGKIIDSGEYKLDDVANKDEESFDYHKDMIYLHNKLIKDYFSDECRTYEKDFFEKNINLKTDEEVWSDGKILLEGNSTIGKSIGANSDIALTGDSVNGLEMVMYSKTGDIKITNKYVSLKGMLYAPYGSIIIDCDYVNFDGVMIAQNVVVDGKGININYTDSWGKYVGIESEEPIVGPNENVDSNDTDKDGLTDDVEKELGTNTHKSDTDGDRLSDGDEILIFGTDPLKKDTDDNGTSDYEEDFDNDGLSNGNENKKGTNPMVDDSDGDDLLDGDEVYKYSTNPLVADTDDDRLDDGDEILFGTDPNNKYSETWGLLDCNLRHEQTFVKEIGDDTSAISEVNISMDATGNVNKTTKVESIAHKDMVSTDVAGLVGEPIEITTTSYFEEATISFEIDKPKLGDTEFDDLMFLWYDEEHRKYVELETKHKGNTVSAETTHFSRYMIVDREKWYEAWKRELHYDQGINNPNIPDKHHNTVLAIDCSVSMLLKDWIETVYDNGLIPLDEYGKMRNKTCNRIKAATGFINNMGSNDKAAIVFFNSSAYKKSEMTNDKDALLKAMQELEDGGNTSFNKAISASIELFDEDTFNVYGTYNRIIMLSDGEATYSKKILDSAKEKGIEIYTVGLGDDSGDEVLNEIAEYCNGEFYKAYEADELIDMYSTFGVGLDFDRTDSDEDGLYDVVESAGIRLQNGNILNGCDPTNPDTDGDGLLDGEEIDPVLKSYEPNQYGSYDLSNTISGYYYAMKSNPCLKDSDNDGYDDVAERNEYKSDPLQCDVEKHRWGKEYVSIIGGNENGEDSFGGNQGWFKSDDIWSSEYIIDHYGCGLISASDILLYMAIVDSRNNSTYTSIVTDNTLGLKMYKEDYKNYISRMNDKVFSTVRLLGVDGFTMSRMMNTYFGENSIELKSKWGVSFSKLKNCIAEMLDKDMPVCLAIGDSSKKLNLYIPTDKTMMKFPLQYDYLYESDSHYVTVTGMVEDRICK